MLARVVEWRSISLLHQIGGTNFFLVVEDKGVNYI